MIGGFGEAFRARLDRFTGASDSALVRERPSPAVWSALEYAAHVRDVVAFYAERIDRVLNEERPRRNVADFASMPERRRPSRRRPLRRPRRHWRLLRAEVRDNEHETAGHQRERTAHKQDPVSDHHGQSACGSGSAPRPGSPRSRTTGHVAVAWFLDRECTSIAGVHDAWMGRAGDPRPEIELLDVVPERALSQSDSVESRDDELDLGVLGGSPVDTRCRFRWVSQSARATR